MRIDQSDSTVPDPAEPCEQCGAELPESVFGAAEILYGPPSGHDFAYRLAGALDEAIKAEPADEDEAGRRCVLAALSLPDFAALVAAYRHFGRYGECRP